MRGYGDREQTRTDHLRDVVAYAGWRALDGRECKELDEFLFAWAMEHDPVKLLFRLACEYLISARVVRQGRCTCSSTWHLLVRWLEQFLEGGPG